MQNLSPGGWAAAVYELTPDGEPEHIVWHPQPELAEADYLLRCLSVRRPGWLRLVPHPALTRADGAGLWPGMFAADEPMSPSLGAREAHPGRRAGWAPLDLPGRQPLASWRQPTKSMLAGLLGAIQLEAEAIVRLSGLAPWQVERFELGVLPDQAEDGELRRMLLARWGGHLDGSRPIRPMDALRTT
jgi:hypothetical protein